MKSSIWIAKRLYYTDIVEHKRQMSRPAVKVALLGIIIGMVVMIITIFVVVGFKKEVTRKITGFIGDIQIANYDNNNTYEMQPIWLTDSTIHELESLPLVSQVIPFVTKPAMIKTDSAFEGIVLKGLPLDEQKWEFYRNNLIEGELPKSESETVISQMIAQKMRLKVGDEYLCYFIQDNVKVRKYHISGIYQTGFEEYDQLFVAGELSRLQKVADLEKEQVSGIDIMVRNSERLDEVSEEIFYLIGNREDADGNFWDTQTVEELAPAIYAWLALLDMNVVVIILLMLAVSGFSMVSGLLIIILDNIQLIGILKALGATNRFIRNIFLTQAALLLSKGMLWGNIIGLSICALQYFTHIIPLDPSAYYVSYVPIAFHWGWWLILNIGTLLISLLILIAPSAIITRISPATVMRFE